MYQTAFLPGFYKGHRIIVCVSKLHVCHKKKLHCSINTYILVLQLLNISQRSFSIGVFPMVLPKKIFSTLSDVTNLREGNISNRRPNLEYTIIVVMITTTRNENNK